MATPLPCVGVAIAISPGYQLRQLDSQLLISDRVLEIHLELPGHKLPYQYQHSKFNRAIKIFI